LTPVAAFHTLKAMEVDFTPELQSKLDRVAAENRRAVDEYVQQLVEAQLDRGEFLSHDEVGSRLRKMLQL